MLWQAARTETNRTWLDTALGTGMRYIELQRLHENPQWFDPRGFVSLPRIAVLKSFRKQRERWVKLNALGKESIPRFLKGRELPTWQVFGEDLQRWALRVGLNPTGLGPKTFRKTWESWLVFIYPEHMAEITLNQGHTSLTSIGHYLNMPFLSEDREGIFRYVEGMF